MMKQVKFGLLAVTGLVAFAVLMALRTEASGMAARSALAVAAFLCAGLALLCVARAWR
jgi:hypothetical protein